MANNTKLKKNVDGSILLNNEAITARDVPAGTATITPTESKEQARRRNADAERNLARPTTYTPIVRVQDKPNEVKNRTNKSLANRWAGIAEPN